MSTVKLGKWSTPKRVRIRPKYSAPSLSRDGRIKMHQSINQSIIIIQFKMIVFITFIFVLLFGHNIKQHTCY